MLIAQNQVISTLRKVRVIREHLQKHCARPQSAILSIMDLHWAVQDVYGLEIEMLEVSFDGEHVKGLLERFQDNKARVIVRSGQPEQERRFVAVKELCHLVIDEEDDWSTFAVDTLKGLIVEVELSAENGLGHENPSRPLQSETLAMVAAIEFMYPFEFRAPDIEKLDRDETTIAKIALEHEIPEHCVEYALRRQKGMAKYWENV